MKFNYDSVPSYAITPMKSVAFATEKGLKHTYLCCKAVEEVDGVVVECGVAQGAQVGVMGRAFTNPRTFHLFDSFDGIPLGGPNDADQPGIGAFRHDVNAPLSERLVSSGVSIGTLEQVRSNMAWFGVRGELNYHKGWFQDTLPALTDFPPIAVLRLDGDLYESTMVCLEHLYPKVVKGGITIIDDYGLPGCMKAVHEYLDANGIKVELSIEDVGGGSVIASWIK